jgi:hypothetical protein
MCVLRVTGRHFDPADYLASSSLKPYSIFRAGEPIFASQPNGKMHEASGFKVDVSQRRSDDLAGQVVDAIAFLKKHKQTLAKLRSVPKVEDVRLDFPLNLRIDRKNVFAQFDYFPGELVSLAGAAGCGLEVSIYSRDLEQLSRSRRKSPRKQSGRSRRKRR